MRIIEAVKIFNDLKKKRVFRDYAVGGAVAMSYYVEPRATRGLDIFLLANYEEHRLTWDMLEELGYKHGEDIIIGDTPVDVVLSFQHPFYEEAITTAKRVKVGDIWTKLFTPEYLIATKQLSFSGRDRIDISNLFKHARVSQRRLEDIFCGGFRSEEMSLFERLKRVMEDERGGLEDVPPLFDCSEKRFMEFWKKKAEADGKRRLRDIHLPFAKKLEIMDELMEKEIQAA